jgi:C-8 sterol isomerase
VGYIFDPDVLLDVARRALGQPVERMVEQIGAELEERYPEHILPNREWVFNNAGGAMGQMMIFHASITEYVIIFGTPTGTEGATGRFAADDWFIMLEGEHWCYGEGDLDRVVTRPGEVSILRRGESKAYRLPDRGFALEYARGNIPMMLPFGLADTFSSTLDFRSLWRTMKLYTRSVVRNLAVGKI